MGAEYVELRCRSAFSFLDGASSPEDLIAAAADGGAEALALGDADGVYGAPRFFAAARVAGVRPIVGADVTLAGAPPLLLLVESRAGYQNLCRLLTAARAGLGKHDPPRATLALLAAHAGGLIALAGAAPRADLAAIVAALGRGNVFLELQRHATPTAAGTNAPRSRRRPRSASASSPPTTSATRRRASASSTTCSPARAPG